MSRTGRRWFDNPFPDYQGGEILVNREALRAQGLELLESALTRGNTDGDGALYVGAVGVTYAYLHVVKHLTEEEKRKYWPMAYRAYENQHKYYLQNPVARTDLCGFLLGKAGFFAVGAVIGKLLGDEKFTKENVDSYARGAEICKPVGYFKPGGDEMLVGRAGYLCGALWMQQQLGYMPISKPDLLDVWSSILESGSMYSKKHKSPSPLMWSYYDTEYLGAAHGACGILQMLLSFPIFLRENAAAENLIRSTVDYYVSLQDENGNFPCSMDEVGPRRARADSDMLVHWCHGSPGAVYMLAKAYLLYRDQRYLDACIKCGEVVWRRGLLRKGPGICHGVAGNGYVFLLIYNLLGRNDPKYLYRALKFSDFLKDPKFLSEARRPDSPYSLYEGIAGTSCFVMDLLQPETSEFPFFNINNNYYG